MTQQSKNVSNDIEVRMSNTLVEARYEYSEIQLDILFYAMACLRKDSNDTAVINYEINITELENLRQSRIDTSRLEEIIEDMGNKPISLRDSDMLDPEDFFKIWPFQGAKYLKGQKILKIKFSELIIPYLFGLKREYTSLQLQSILLMTSKYAKRIYQICCQWKNSHNGESRIYDLDEFRTMIGLGDQYTMISMFKSRILDVAQKQINQYTDLKISYKLLKKGKQFAKIKFIISEKAAPQIPIDYHYNERQARAKIQLEKLGIVDESIIQQILQSHLDKFFEWHYAYQTQKFTIKTSAAGHLLKTLGIK